jgi:thiol-disulfide isomerase/thioredoxin
MVEFKIKVKMKSSSLIILFYLFVFDSIGQNQAHLFTLKGLLLDCSNDSMQVSYVNASGKYLKKYLHVVNSTFELSDTIYEPTRITVQSPAYRTRPISLNETDFFVEPGNNHINLSISDFGNPSGLVNQSNQDYSAFNQLLYERTKFLDSLLDAINNQLEIASIKEDSLMMSSLQQTIELVQAKRNKIYNITSLDFVRSHPNSFISIRQFYVLSNEVNIDTLIELYNSLSEMIKYSRTGVAVYEMLQNIASTRPGNLIPNLVVTDLQNKVISLKDLYKSGPVLLDFWASWCGPCIADMPAIKSLEATYKNLGFKVVYISIDGKNSKAWQRGIAENELSKNVNYLLLGNGIDELTKRLAVQAIPDKILIDRHGKIIYRKVGAGTKDLEEQLRLINL